MTTAIEKLNEALGAITEVQKGLEGENLILSLKSIKNVVKAMETVAKITKEEKVESEKTEAGDVETAEEKHEEEPPVEAVEDVEEEVKEEEQELDEYGLPQTDDLHSSSYRREMVAYDNAPQDKKDIYDELAKHSVKDYFMILGEGRSGWCEYSKEMLFDTSKVSMRENGKSFYLNEYTLHNPADCRYSARNYISFHEDGKMCLNGMPCKVALVKRGRGGQWLAIFDEQAVDDRKVNKAQILEYRDPELLKKLIFG